MLTLSSGGNLESGGVSNSVGKQILTLSSGGNLESGGVSNSVGKQILKTGQTTSYRTGDDGDIRAGRETSFLTLDTNNPFGNLNRFTKINGNPGTPLTVEWILDWSTYSNGKVLGYVNYFWSLGSFNWDSAIDFCLTYSLEGFSGCRLANAKEMVNLISYEKEGLNYPPFNLSGGVNTFSSSTLFLSTTFAYNTVWNDGRITYISKTQQHFILPVRTFEVNGTNIT